MVFTSLAAVFILYTHTNVINGWTLPQMIVLLGVYYIVQGANAVVFETSFQRFMEQVRLGTLDFVLIKPADSQFMVSTRHIQVPQLGQAILGRCLGVGMFESASSDAAAALAFAVTLCAAWRWSIVCCWS